ncbi:respiratory chain complex I subunit 1 family protein [Caldiplasma sukawensis]
MWYSKIVETLEQFIFVILLSPLFTGLLNNIKGKLEFRKGPPIFQPYYDIIKLFRKETLIPDNSSIIFLYSPYMAFAVYLLISLIIPVVIPVPIYFTASADFLGGAILFTLAGFIKAIGAMDSKNNYSAMSVARISSFGFLSEATLITVFFSVSLLSGTNNPYVENNILFNSPESYLNLTHIFSLVAFFMLYIYETGKIPVESEGTMELGMIDSGINYEYSGKLLAINKWSSSIKAYLLGAVLINVFLFPYFNFYNFPFILIDPAIIFIKFVILVIIIAIIETAFAKLRLFRIVDFLATAFTFSLLFLIFAEVIK